MLSISEQLSDIQRNTVELNRQKLRSIIKTVVLCGKQDMALRGHRDDLSHLDESSGNPGIFQALLNFRVEAGDKVLANHFANGPRNATYRSKTIQNEIIEVLGTYIQDKIVAEINEAGAFSLLADEASDKNNKEQLPLVLRFVDKERNVREEFVGFYECEDGVTGQAIATLILKAVQELGLSMDFCKGQCYDGAGNMSGPCNGAAAIVRRQYPKAIYTHCMAHRLNLSVVSACKIQNVRNMFDTVGEVTRSFEYSPKKEALLVQKVKDVCAESRRHKLLDVCKTRWIQRIDGLEVFLELYEAIVATLETIKANADRSWNADSTKKAVSHYHAIANFDFVVTLTVCQAVLMFTKGLTVKMQGTFSEGDRLKYDKVKEKFDQYFLVRRNVIYERAKFNQRTQADETAEEFITSLHCLAEHCNFGALKEEMIRDRIVVGVKDATLSEKMQLESTLTLEKAVKMARESESVKKQQEVIRSGQRSTSTEIDEIGVIGAKFRAKLQKFPPKKSGGVVGARDKSNPSSCLRCGLSANHTRGNCPAINSVCHKCSKKGHYARVCMSQQVEEVVTEDQFSEDPDTSVFLGEISGDSMRAHPWKAEILVNGDPVSFKLDSGADVSVISEKTYGLLSIQEKLLPPDKKLYGPCKVPLFCKGKFTASLTHNLQCCADEIYVVPGLEQSLLEEVRVAGSGQLLEFLVLTQRTAAMRRDSPACFRG